MSYSKKEVQRAGEALQNDELWRDDNAKFKFSMQVLSDWRSKHEKSLDQVTENLKLVSSKVDKKSIVVKRLKRAPSIISKLQRFKSMKLRNMQDIAGCRSILENTKSVYKVKRELKRRNNFKSKDYIKTPKEDGYRGIHLVGKYLNETDGCIYPVEIQLRSRIQHSWATAVEIVDLFTNQALKSNDGQRKWLDFFKYISHEFSKLENVNNIPIKDSHMKAMRLTQELDVFKRFEAYAGSLQIFDEHAKKIDDGYNLITIYLNSRKVEVTSFPAERFEYATQAYLKKEKAAAQNTDLMVALVSSHTIENLKEAYPNYFADSAMFVYYLKEVSSKFVTSLPKNTVVDLVSRIITRAGL